MDLRAFLEYLFAHEPPAATGLPVGPDAHCKYSRGTSSSGETNTAARESAPGTVGEAAVIAVVDRALGIAAHREFFIRDEASSVFGDLRGSVRRDESRDAIGAVIDRALESYRGDLVLDRSRVVDPLLDIRLALTHRDIDAPEEGEPALDHAPSS